MKPLYNLTDKSKETFFSLSIYDILAKIEKQADEWFVDTFLEPKEYIPNELLIRNLKDNLDYLFTEAIWLINLCAALGYEVKDSKRSVKEAYDKYTAKEDGYRYLVHNRRYDVHENKLLTEEESVERQKQINKIMLDMFKELK